MARALAETDSPAGSANGQIYAWTGTPIAHCDVSPEETSPLTGEATWIGSESDDVDGSGIAEYQWTLVSAPDGSAARMPEGGADREGFVPDLAGTYVAELVVKTAAGSLSAPCQAVLEAVPQQRLWVELSWDRSGDDLDLHLLAPGGELESDTDCYYRNCVGGGLDWGESGDSADDPRLDLDDVEGTGPENINLDEPGDGLYTVVVHDFPGSVDHEDNTFTVNIWVDGVWLYREWYTVDGEDSYSSVATVTFPEGLITWPDGYTASP
jgi:hypothetical protein